MLELGTHEPVAMAAIAPVGPALLDVAGLHAWYGESHVLHGVDLNVRQGETVCLLGRNGAGKTTTLRAILGIVGRREGRVMLDGGDLTDGEDLRIFGAATAVDQHATTLGDGKSDLASDLVARAHPGGEHDERSVDVRVVAEGHP